MSGWSDFQTSTCLPFGFASPFGLVVHAPKSQYVFQAAVGVVHSCMSEQSDDWVSVSLKMHKSQALNSAGILSPATKISSKSATYKLMCLNFKTFSITSNNVVFA